MSKGKKTGPTRTRQQGRAANTVSPDELAAIQAAVDAVHAEGSVDELEPLRIDASTPMPTRIVVAYLDDVPLSVPKEPNPFLLLDFMRASQTNLAAAVGKLCIDMLGQEAVDALASDPRVTKEHIAQINERIQRVAFDSIAQLVDLVNQGNSSSEPES